MFRLQLTEEHRRERAPTKGLHTHHGNTATRFITEYITLFTHNFSKHILTRLLYSWHDRHVQNFSRVPLERVAPQEAVETFPRLCVAPSTLTVHSAASHLRLAAAILGCCLSMRLWTCLPSYKDQQAKLTCVAKPHLCYSCLWLYVVQ